jgi:hypothetical protein
MTVKPPTRKGVGFQPPGRSPGVSQVWPVTNIPGLATVLSSDAL